MDCLTRAATRTFPSVSVVDGLTLKSPAAVKRHVQYLHGFLIILPDSIYFVQQRELSPGTAAVVDVFNLHTARLVQLPRSPCALLNFYLALFSVAGN